MRRQLSDIVQRILTGFAAGVMVAASVWSLLIPAIEQAAWMRKLSFVPAFVGFWIGILFLLGLDHLIPHLCIDCSNGKVVSWSPYDGNGVVEATRTLIPTSSTGSKTPSRTCSAKTREADGAEIRAFRPPRLGSSSPTRSCPLAAVCRGISPRLLPLSLRRRNSLLPLTTWGNAVERPPKSSLSLI